jgi:hypothetical protein
MSASVSFASAARILNWIAPFSSIPLGAMCSSVAANFFPSMAPIVSTRSMPVRSFPTLRLVHLPLEDQLGHVRDAGERSPLVEGVGLDHRAPLLHRNLQDGPVDRRAYERAGHVAGALGRAADDHVQPVLRAGQLGLRAVPLELGLAERLVGDDPVGPEPLLPRVLALGVVDVDLGEVDAVLGLGQTRHLRDDADLGDGVAAADRDARLDVELSMIPETCGLISTSFLGMTEPVATVFFTMSVTYGFDVAKTTFGFCDFFHR